MTEKNEIVLKQMEKIVISIIQKDSKLMEMLAEC